MLKILGTEKNLEKVTIEDDVVKENIKAYLHILDLNKSITLIGGGLIFVPKNI